MAFINSKQQIPRVYPVPQHVGPKVLPNFTLLNQLLYYAARHSTIAIDDVALDIHASHAQLLSDVLHLRNELQAQLELSVQQRLLRGEEVYICLLASGGYEFAVGFLAIMALGAIIVPICK